MCSLNLFKIDLKALEEGLSDFHFSLDDEYFKAIEASNVQGGNVCVDLSVRRNDKVFTLNFHTRGVVRIPCDRCLDEMEQPIETNDSVVAKLGEENSEEDEDVVTVAEDEGILDVAWLIYEFIALGIPVKHVHAPGKCNPAMIRMLEEYSAARSGEEGKDTVDPRWEVLKNLKL